MAKLWGSYINFETLGLIDKKYKEFIISYNKFIILQSFIIVFVDVSATAAAFVRTTVYQWQTVSKHRCVEVRRTPRLGSSTCLVLS